MKIAIHQINPKLGDFKYNSQIIIDSIKQSQKEKAELIVFPELALSGYPGFDVLERPSFVKTQWKQIEKIKKVVKPGVLVVVGGISENKNTKAKPFFNSAIIIEGSKKVKIIPKSLLPSYDVFDESRFFEAGNFQSNLIRFKNKNILIGVCEDFWFWDTKATQWLGGENPLKKYKNKKIDLIVQINGSPFSKKALEKRKAIALKTSRYLNSPMIYVNLVGGQDELIFDGNSFIISVEKKSNLPCYYLKNFEPDNFSFFLEKLKEIKQKQIKKNKNQVLFNSLCLGLSDFVLKNGFSKVHLGLSGGIDSALVLAIAVESLGKNNVSAIAMPGPFNAPESLLLAEKMCLGLDVNFYKIPIETSYELINQNYQKCVEKMAFGIVQENIQARLRGLYLMAFSNNKNSLLLNTSNKTELATGYSTLYGDLCGGMSPIGDLLKTEVIEISKWLNRDKEVIPKRIIDRPPSAELRPNQKDEDSLLAYSKLDKIVEKLICKKKSPRTQEEFTVARMVANSQFKRWQAPPILRVSEHAFGIGRRIPITNAFKH